MVAIVILAASFAGAEDLAIKDRSLKNVRVDRVEPDGVTITHAAGICKLGFDELPAEWKARYDYDPVKAAAYQEQIRQQLLQQRKKGR